MSRDVIAKADGRNRVMVINALLLLALMYVLLWKILPDWPPEPDYIEVHRRAHIKMIEDFYASIP